MSDNPADVSIAGVVKSFGSTRVLRGLDLEVPAGTLTAVLGPSGCGKTTLLRVLAGFEDPDAGQVRIGGCDVVGGGQPPVPAHRRRVGLMPQEGALFPHLSVAGNITFGLSRAERAASSGTAEHWLDVVGLAGYAQARPHELSGGQQQRVALARALAARPRVLLLDEPFAALDAGLRGRVREDIAAILAEAGTTTLLVTHDQSEALSLADSVALLLDGTVTQHSTPVELYRAPTTIDAARFVGATVEVAGIADGATVHTPLGALPSTMPAGGSPTSGPVVAVLRPEQVQLTDAGLGCPAVVTATRFYGAETTVEVRLPDGERLTLRSVGAAGPQVGEQVSVCVRGDVLAYPSPTGGKRMSLSEAGG